MSVFVRNFQQRVLFSEALLERDARVLVQLLKADRFDVSIVCAGGKRIKSLNLKYRRRNVQTDVLAFPYFENMKPGVLPNPKLQDDWNLGDVILGMPVIHQDCQEDNKSVQEYLPMHKKEKEVLSGFNQVTGYNTKPLLPAITPSDRNEEKKVINFLEYHPQTASCFNSSDARVEKTLQRYLIKVKNSPLKN
ncbi:endoribonuclease YbeY isoform X2 [Nematostella vectensis]|uniref:endoribonuclease YbeY isoform X2 n=1 Tax=Nematostella vectensis TaxID=45351 RepID=UPI00138FDEE6|nr:endoribonuclease YbeY isoform X2 [Nematostella vectensis]